MTAIQLQDACAALIGAKRSLDDVAAKAKDMPLVLGRKAAIASIGSSLDRAMTQLEIAGTSLGAIDAHAAATITDAAMGLRQVATGLQSRSGVKLLHAKPFTEAHRHIHALGAQARMAIEHDTWPSAATVDTITAPILAKSVTDLTTDEFRRLADVAALPAAIRPANLDEAKLRRVIDLMESNPSPNSRIVHRINETRALIAFPTKEAAEEHLTAILRLPEAELTAAHVEQLDMLVQLPLEVRPAALAKLDPLTFSVAMDPARTPELPEVVLIKLSAVRNATLLQDADVVRAELTKLLSKSYDDMTPADLRALGDFDGSSFTDPAIPMLRSSLRRMAAQLEGDGNFANFHGALSNMDKLRAQLLWGDRESSTARLAEILSTPPERVTRQDIHDLGGLLKLPDTVRPLALRGISIDAKTVSERAESVGRGEPFNPSGYTYKAFIKAKERMDATASATGDIA